VLLYCLGGGYTEPTVIYPTVLSKEALDLCFLLVGYLDTIPRLFPQQKAWSAQFIKTNADCTYQIKQHHIPDYNLNNQISTGIRTHPLNILFASTNVSVAWILDFSLSMCCWAKNKKKLISPKTSGLYN
jgi:hypothetical protein